MLEELPQGLQLFGLQVLARKGYAVTIEVVDLITSGEGKVAGIRRRPFVVLICQALIHRKRQPQSINKSKLIPFLLRSIARLRGTTLAAKLRFAESKRITKLELNHRALKTLAGNLPNSDCHGRNVNIRTGLVGFILCLLGSETISAVYGPVPFRLERHARQSAAFGTVDLSGAVRILSTALDSHKQAAVRTALRLVNQSFGAEKLLLAGRKYENPVAIATG